VAKKKGEKTTVLQSDQPTIELVIKAKGGDALALEALLERCLPPLRRFAHGRMRGPLRAYLDTGDLVQDAAMNAIRRLDTFEPRRVGALQAYLRRAVINKIRDEVRRVRRRPALTELLDNIPSTGATVLEEAIRNQRTIQYQAALKRLRPKDRELVVARVESQWTTDEIAQFFGFSTKAAAQMAVKRAQQRLMKEVENLTRPAKPRA
jgi:RNA polymerase sigma-70 factor (ECF subfamily)